MEYLGAENAYTDAVMAPTEELQQRLYDEILSRIQETDTSAPTPRPPYLYYSRTEEGKQYSIICRRKDEPDAPEEILFDENAMAEGHDYFSLGVMAVSEDHTLAAYSEDFTGGESYTMRVKDLATGEDLPDVLEGTYYSFAWANDGRRSTTRRTTKRCARTASGCTVSARAVATTCSSSKRRTNGSSSTSASRVRSGSSTSAPGA